MTTHHEFFTIETRLPKRLLSSIEIDALYALGLVMFDDGHSLSMCSGLEPKPFPTLEVDDPAQALHAIARDYAGEFKPDWVARFEVSLRFMVDNAISDTARFALPGYGVTVVTVLEDSICKRANSGHERINEISLKVSYYDDQARPDPASERTVLITPEWTQQMSMNGVERHWHCNASRHRLTDDADVLFAAPRSAAQLNSNPLITAQRVVSLAV